ncbi:MFS transporter [Enterobacter cancerogenus]|uniref:MFS transporter n=1 Tax=Enterobacter cancerogenus TaxID=69218 RepID=UPI000537B982|nr:MFS transporter [Enterobacter cancerogenus]KGT88706.1 MFS transporter [Enterobacter cancerogenus]
MNKARYLLVGVAFTLTALLYIDRVAISVAKESVTGEFGLTDTEFGWVLSIFALGYAIFQAPAGAMADKWGPRKMLAIFVLIWSAFTGLTGLAWGFASLLVFRFLFGLAEAGAFPTFARAIYSWLPAGERALAQGINLSGSRLGAAFALPFVAWLLTTAGWRESFLILCAVGLIWAVCWYAWFRNDPAEHKSISKAELAIIEAGRESNVATSENSTPPDMSFRSGNMWLLMGQYFASNFTLFFALTWLFPYLKKTYELDAVTTGFLAAAPLVAGAIGNWTGGAVVDFLYRRGLGMYSRRLPAMFGFALSAAGMFGCMSADSAVSAVAWLCLAVFGSDITVPASWAYCIDTAGKKSGVVSGKMNMAGNLGSFVTSLAFPYLMLAFNSTTPFFIAAMGFNLLAVIFWLRLSSGKREQRVPLNSN